MGMWAELPEHLRVALDDALKLSISGSTVDVGIKLTDVVLPAVSAQDAVMVCPSPPTIMFVTASVPPTFSTALPG